VKIRSLRVDGFGRLADRTFAFGPALSVVVGPNEAGKSTLAAALVASLYGLQRGEKDRWRPWNAGAFSTALTYETVDGAVWEVHRALDRDTKGVRVFDERGADAAARLGLGKSLNPGDVHLQISLDVFLQTACMRQGATALESGTANEVATALAHALGGGPKEDAALGALKRLDDAQREHVGTERAHKNVPLKRLRDQEAENARAAREARAALERLTALREKIAAARTLCDRDTAAAGELERRARGLRAANLRARLDALREYRDEFARVQRAREAFDDVAGFAADRVAELDDAYHSWRSSDSVAEAAARGVSDEALSDAECRELAERSRDAGNVDDAVFAALCAASEHAEAARTRSTSAAGEAAAARRDGDGGGPAGGALVVAALVATASDVGVAVAHLWLWTAIASAIAITLALAAFSRARSRTARRREADAKQRLADAALADEATAAAAVARVLEPLGIVTIDELARRRDRLRALTAREHAALKAETRASTAREAALAEAARFDALAGVLVPDAGGDRAARRAEAIRRAKRRNERDGLDARLAMLAMQRSTILHGDEDYALQAEFDALLAGGAEPAAADDPKTLRALEAQRVALDERAREGERSVATLEGELRAGEETVADIAELDEEVAATRREIARLDAFDRALRLARTTIESRKEEAHRAFARRLEEYSAGVLGTITGGRYGEVRLDPATLEIRVRVPETGAFEELDKLSAGTRDQIALVVRFATARMFAEGLETPPLLLDDPFAFWDAQRIARCLPVLTHGAQDAQCILFTASTELAAAAAAGGATVIELSGAIAGRA
jgi:DNA repair exonuclease SbcCD ATPase subunit